MAVGASRALRATARARSATDEVPGRIRSKSPDVMPGALDVAGGPYEEHRIHSIGSGSLFADDDSATGGPDLTRQLFPVVVTVTEDGFSRLSDSEAARYAEQVVAGRMNLPDGPTAPLREVS